MLLRCACDQLKEFYGCSVHTRYYNLTPTITNRMGTCQNHKNKRKHAKNRSFKRVAMDLKNRGRDIDRIQDDIKKAADGAGAAAFVEEDAPGGGLFYCLPCARHFISDAVLKLHIASKPHKKRVKVVAEPQYTQREADAGAGMSHE